jgi:hypothetical membrane protein
MEKLDNFYEKLNGSYFGIISFLVSLVSVTTAQILYMEADPSFSMNTNFVSDLGTGPNGSDIIFSIGMILTGTLIMPFYVYIGWNLQKGEAWDFINIGMIMGLIGSLGMILVGVFPLNPNDNLSYHMHIIAAGILFYGFLCMLLIYGISEYRDSKISNLLSFLSFITAGLFGAFITSVIIQFLSSETFQAYTYILEWIGLYSAGLWIIAHVYYTLKHK